MDRARQSEAELDRFRSSADLNDPGQAAYFGSCAPRWPPTSGPRHGFCTSLTMLWKSRGWTFRPSGERQAVRSLFLELLVSRVLNLCAGD